MTEEKNQVIPFGKHKGKTVEEVQTSDPSYINWLTAQDWFREKFVVLHQTIIHSAEPEETPEHNALQVMFLDDEFCFKFIRAAGLSASSQPMKNWRRWFEWRGIDVMLGLSQDSNQWLLMIEIKPTVGDDYPAILRQIGAAAARSGYTPHAVLFLERYTGTGATREQFIKIFKASNISVVFLDQVC